MNKMHHAIFLNYIYKNIMNKIQNKNLYYSKELFFKILIVIYLFVKLYIIISRRFLDLKKNLF